MLKVLFTSVSIYRNQKALKSNIVGHGPVTKRQGPGVEALMLFVDHGLVTRRLDLVVEAILQL